MTDSFALVLENFLGNPGHFEEVDDAELIGGAEINLYRTAQLLLDEGYDVTVIQEDTGLDIEEYDGINMEYVPVPDISGSLRRLVFNYRWREYVPNDAYVHVHAEDYAIPFYDDIDSVNQQGLTWDYPGSRDITTRVKLFFLSRLLEQGAYVRASDNSFLTYVQSEHTDYRNRVFPIPNGVDTNRFRPRPVSPESSDIDFGDKVSILFPRSLRIARGADIFVEALNELTNERDDFVALFLGAQKSSARGPIMEKVERYGLEDQVEFLGHVPNEEMPEYYNLSDIVTIPTYHSEGSSIACIEALACGKPLVVTDVGGLKELVYQDDTDGGFKVKPTPGALATALQRLIDDPDLRERFGRNARARAEKYYTIERWEDQMRSYFERVTRNR